MDLLVSAIILILFSPIIFLIAIILLVTQGFPILFCQHRPGKDAKIFKLCKFRTMRQPGKTEVGPEADESRITPFGRFLRQTSLDEIPEFFNVFKGEMSLVGPRPLLTKYLDRYTTEQARRHNVLPGITGWAQINGRNAIRWDEKFELDNWYVDHWNIWLDFRILLMTIGTVFSGEGISQPGRATMEEFMGSDPEQRK